MLKWLSTKKILGSAARPAWSGCARRGDLRWRPEIPCPSLAAMAARWTNRFWITCVAIVAIVAIALSGTLISGSSDAQSARPTPSDGATGPDPDERYAWRPVAIGGGGFITGFSV